MQQMQSSGKNINIHFLLSLELFHLLINTNHLETRTLCNVMRFISSRQVFESKTVPESSPPHIPSLKRSWDIYNIAEMQLFHLSLLFYFIRLAIWLVLQTAKTEDMACVYVYWESKKKVKTEQVVWFGPLSASVPIPIIKKQHHRFI